MESKDWVLLIKNQTRGPYSRGEVEQLLSSGEARYSDYIWTSKLTKWYPVREIANVNFDPEQVGGTTEPISDATSPKEDFFSEVVFQPRERVNLAFIEEDPAEAETENLAFSPLRELVSEIVWDKDLEMIQPEKKTGTAYSSRLLHLTQSFGFSIRNTEKPFILGWFFVISGLLMLLAYIL